MTLLNKLLLLKILLVLTFCWGPIAAANGVKALDLGVSISSSAQREAFYALVQHFEQLNPGVEINIKAYTSEDYKLAFPELLAGENNFDILYWHAGERLMEFVDKKQVLPLDDLWKQQAWQDSFDESVSQVISDSNHKYGLPISYYQIGFYYRKSLFKRLDISEPETWKEFLSVCEALKLSGLAPIYIGTQSNWPATAWFDYLNLRTNGLGFHLQLMRGEVSFFDKRITQVLDTWLELLDANYFINGHENLGWKEGLPSIYRGMAGMSMIGNYVIQDIPQSVVDDIGFFPFPEINPNVDSYEEGPLDILLIPKKSKHAVLAKRFLAFAGNSQVQSRFNKTLGVISPHRAAQIGTVGLVTEAYQSLSNAAGISQFFDRDAEKEFADTIMPVIDNFMLSKNVAVTQQAMENARLALYPSIQIEK